MAMLSFSKNNRYRCWKMNHRHRIALKIYHRRGLMRRVNETKMGYAFIYNIKHFTHPDHIVDRLCVRKSSVKIDHSRTVSENSQSICLRRKYNKYHCWHFVFFVQLWLTISVPLSLGGYNWFAEPHWSQSCWQQPRSCLTHGTQPD